VLIAERLRLVFQLGGVEMSAGVGMAAGACILAWCFLFDSAAVLGRLHEQRWRNLTRIAAQMSYPARLAREESKSIRSSA
jgi:hypothetical protein